MSAALEFPLQRFEFTPKADPEEQAAFLKTQLRPRLRQAPRGQRTVLFVDAAHFVYGPFLGYLWCLVRLLVPGASGRQRYNVLAALNMASLFKPTIIYYTPPGGKTRTPDGDRVNKDTAAPTLGRL